MKGFTDKLIIQNDTDLLWTLYSEFEYTNDEYSIICKKGYVTDGASIPRFFWSIIGSPMEGSLVKPAVIHDGLYTIMSLPRKTCDRLLLEMLLYNNVSKWKAYTIYYVVRLFGNSHWKKDSTTQHTLININKNKE